MSIYPNDETSAAAIAALQADIGDWTGVLGMSMLTFLASQTRLFQRTITSPANSGPTLIATVGVQPVVIDGVILRANASVPGVFVASAVLASGVIFFLTAEETAEVRFQNVDDTVSNTGPNIAELPVGRTIVMDLNGSGAAAVNLTITISYRAVALGGVLV